MVKKALITAITLAPAASFAVSAAESGSSKDQHAKHTTALETVELPGGGSVQVSHFKLHLR